MAATVFGGISTGRSTSVDHASRRRTGELSGGTLITLVFITAMVALAALFGGMVLAVGLGALLFVGSALVSVGGDALTARQAANLGVVHLLAFVLLTI